MSSVLDVEEKSYITMVRILKLPSMQFSLLEAFLSVLNLGRLHCLLLYASHQTGGPQVTGNWKIGGGKNVGVWIAPQVYLTVAESPNVTEAEWKLCHGEDEQQDLKLKQSLQRGMLRDITAGRTSAFLNDKIK
jgi:hypothetical protein